MYKLSPSDFRYLWEDCKHCFYQKVKHGITLPSIGLPGIFSKMSGLFQSSIQGKNLKDINPALPSGIIEIKEGFLKSVPIPPGKDCFISGRFDIISRLDDGTWAVIDFKISDPKEEKVQKFRQQLHAYKFALENPPFGEPKKISKMGVVVVSPETIEFQDGGVVFKSKPNWFEIAEDMNGFFDFISGVSDLLNGPVPKINNECQWCKYRLCFDKTAQANGFQEEIPF
ncbi:PD-(D/E)XK nuclease family protein [Candidatus Berkelbacteria bacterium]|nr:PD-(D/E)XK nuclease family protein [Candidatus Berkelbacteria bacterium]